MANTYSKIHLQFVFAVKHRQSLIDPKWKHELYKYITGIVTNKQHKLLAINGMPDHIHILVGMRPHQSVADLMRDVKASSAKWINEKNLAAGNFEWQEGYGVFSYDFSSLDNVIRYIKNQEKHHADKKFRDEFHGLLKELKIDYDEKYTFRNAE